MIIGLDFDNTIVCYDQAIKELSANLTGLPANLPRTKVDLRDFLRSQNREPEWTAFQGALYGPGMRYAEPFEGAVEAMICLESMAHQLVIVSHRSPKPYAGPEYDLHEAARNWVSRILQPAGLFPSDAVYFLPTKQQKIQAIKTLGCSAFLDDLPEILDDEAFPESTTSILFRPSGEQSVVTHSESGAFLCTRWEDLPRIVGNLQ